jgi:hypothetical protein
MASSTNELGKSVVSKSPKAIFGRKGCVTATEGSEQCAKERTKQRSMNRSDANERGWLDQRARDARE